MKKHAKLWTRQYENWLKVNIHDEDEWSRKEKHGDENLWRRERKRGNERKIGEWRQGKSWIGRRTMKRKKNCVRNEK